MRPHTALLVESEPNGNNVRTTLQAILSPDFKLEVLAHALASEDPPLLEFVDHLKKSLQQIDAALMFLTLFRKSLNQTRKLLETIRQILDLPIVVVVELGHPTQIME